MAKNYYVQIIKYSTGQRLERFGPYSGQKAEKVDTGINVNLDHESFYTLVGTKEELG